MPNIHKKYYSQLVRAPACRASMKTLKEKIIRDNESYEYKYNFDLIFTLIILSASPFAFD